MHANFQKKIFDNNLGNRKRCTYLKGYFSKQHRNREKYQTVRDIGGSKKFFVHFDICYSPIFLLFKMGSYV